MSFHLIRLQLQYHLLFEFLQFMEETERSLHDAIMIVRRAIKNDAVVAGGGAIEMEVSKYLRDCSRSVAGKEQLIIAAMAKGIFIKVIS